MQCLSDCDVHIVRELAHFTDSLLADLRNIKWKWASKSCNVKCGGRGKTKYVNALHRLAGQPVIEQYDFALLILRRPPVEDERTHQAIGYLLSERVNDSACVVVDRCHTYECRADASAVLLHHCAKYWLEAGVQWLSDGFPGFSIEQEGSLRYKQKYHPRVDATYRWSPYMSTAV